MTIPFEIRDPIYGPIQVDPDEKRIIDSPYVQRMRGIKQTGFAELAFPGATHNRYTHSLGAFHLSGRAFNQIFEKFPWKDKSERSKFKSLLRMAALLHDVGHGPLSHAIEQAMPPRKELNGLEGQATHEDYSLAIVGKSSLSKLLKETYGEEMPNAIISLIKTENECPEFFKAGIEAWNIFPILSSLISGEIDVDRMDYMVRDSLYCGTTYGNFDRDWIFSNLLFQEIDGDVHLAMDSRALYAFEDFLLSRYHMYLIVYLHHKSVVYDEMLFQYLQEDAHKTRIPADLDEYLKVNDHWLWSRLAESSSPWARRIIEQKPYKMLLEVKADQTDEAKKYADELEAKLIEEKVPYFRSSSTGLLSKYLHKPKSKKAPLYIIYRDPRFTSGFKPGIRFEPVSEATELYERYKKRRILDRIYADTQSRKIEFDAA